MSFLDNRIPPPIVALIIAILMWLVSLWLPATGLSADMRYGGGVLFLIVGAFFSTSGMRAFRRAGTTVNPIKIENASELVTNGIYRITRNPMYVGVTLVLCGWAFFLDSLWMLLGPVVFVAYVTRF